jgi:DNA invertase Pin-like site-specific DNA recombinase
MAQRIAEKQNKKAHVAAQQLEEARALLAQGYDPLEVANHFGIPYKKLLGNTRIVEAQAAGLSISEAAELLMLSPNTLKATGLKWAPDPLKLKAEAEKAAQDAQILEAFELGLTLAEACRHTGLSLTVVRKSGLPWPRTSQIQKDALIAQAQALLNSGKTRSEVAFELKITRQKLSRLGL